MVVGVRCAVLIGHGTHLQRHTLGVQENLYINESNFGMFDSTTTTDTPQLMRYLMLEGGFNGESIWKQRSHQELEAEMEKGVNAKRYVGKGVSQNVRLMLSPDHRSIVCVKVSSKRAGESTITTVRRAVTLAATATTSANISCITTKSKAVAFLVDVTELTKGQASKVQHTHTHSLSLSLCLSVSLSLSLSHAQSTIESRTIGLERFPLRTE
jgi:hypothetical protein